MKAGLAGLALSLLLPVAAAAHGEHDGHAGMDSTGATVTAQGYQVELATDPSPLAVGREGHVVAKISRDSTPVSGATVLIGVAAPGTEPEMKAAPEAAWAGSYETVHTPIALGPHEVRIVVTALETGPLASALAVDFPIEIVHPPGMGAATWTLLAVVAGISALALYGVAVRARLGAPTEPFNLLRVPWLRRLLTSRALQPSLQIPLLILMAVVVLLGFHDVQDGGTNLATKLTWTIWWAGIIFTFVLAGRVWCLACPFGALNEWASRLAAPIRRLPRPFRNLWWATAMFVVLTWADEQLGVVRSPRVTAWIVLLFVGLAVAVGLLYQRRSFCRFLCPIGGLIGIYSMTAPIELRAEHGALCLAHREKSCYRGDGHARGCPMFEFPQAMDRNTYCNFCFECVKACPRENLAFRFRAFAKDLWTSGRRALDESFLAVALVGLTLSVTAQMLGAWPGWMATLAAWLPGFVRASLKPVTYLGLVESAVLLGSTLVVAPLLVLAASAAADRLAGDRGLGLRRTFVVFGYMFVPVGLAMHLAHNLSHLLREGGGIVPVVQRALAVYTPFRLGEPDWRVTALAPEPVVALLQVAIIVGFFAVSLAVGLKIAQRVYPDPRTATRALLPMAALSFLFTAIGIAVLSLPMAMRHGL